MGEPRADGDEGDELGGEVGDDVRVAYSWPWGDGAEARGEEDGGREGAGVGAGGAAGVWLMLVVLLLMVDLGWFADAVAGVELEGWSEREGADDGDGVIAVDGGRKVVVGLVRGGRAPDGHDGLERGDGALAAVGVGW